MTKVLLAEDDTNMAFLLKTLLSMDGYQVTVLDFTKDILSGIVEAKPDVLLMDVHLHDKNGVEVLRELRKNSTMKNTIVIMCSGMSLESECMAAGANKFMLKPYMPDDLLTAIKSTLVN